MSFSPMPSRYLLDEHLRGALWDAIYDYNVDPKNWPILASCVGDPPGPSLGTDDHTMLRWAESEEWILVSCDKRTLPTHFYDHLAAGGHCPGLFLLPNQFSIPEALEFLTLAAHAADSSEWRDRITYCL